MKVLYEIYLTPGLNTFGDSALYSGQENVLVLHLADVYHLDAYKAGLAFIAAVVPTLISMPLTGHLADKNGAEWVIFLTLLLSIPWWGVITLRGNLIQFLVIYAFEGEVSPLLNPLCGTHGRVTFVVLFTAGLVSPLMTELAAVSRSIEGVGC